MLVTKKKFNNNKEEFVGKIRNGAVFIYPTDTIYGIGCNALSSKSVKKIRRIKQRAKTPFSVIAPSKRWIKEYCAITKEAKKWINKLPGKYTLILKTKRKLPKEIAPGLSTIGVRIPKHWFSGIAKKLNLPIITTSANISGRRFMTSLNDLDNKIKENVDFIIYEGKKKAKPSRIIDLTEKIKIIKR